MSSNLSTQGRNNSYCLELLKVPRRIKGPGLYVLVSHYIFIFIYECEYMCVHACGAKSEHWIPEVGVAGSYKLLALKI